MTHSLIIEEVLAHPQDISWLPWAGWSTRWYGELFRDTA
ncbi:hypothetical protein, partial [Salmonella enterica]